MLGQLRQPAKKLISTYSTRGLAYGTPSKWVGLTSVNRLNGISASRFSSPLVLNAIGIRFNSTVTAKEQLVPRIAEDGSAVIEPTLLASVEPTTTAAATLQAGDFAALGLCNYTPVGLLEKSMELMALTGLPWWGIIPVLTVGIRLLSLPLIIGMNHATTRMNNIRPDMEAITNRLKRAQANKDPFECQVQSQKLQALFKEHNINPLKLFMAPLVQAPIMISFFLALRAMAEVNVPGLADGGLYWFTNLTVSDPYYILPVVSSLGLLATLELGAMMGPAMGAGNPEWVRWAFRAIALVSLPATASLPAAVFVYWVPSNIFSIFQIILLNNPRLRKMIGLPVLIRHPPPGPAVLASQAKPKKFSRLLSA